MISHILKSSCLLAFIAIQSANAFSISSNTNLQVRNISPITHPTISHLPVLATNNNNEEGISNNNVIMSNQQRRDFLISGSTAAAATATILSSLSTFPELATAAEGEQEQQQQQQQPICVIGANGKTGSECVGYCLKKGIPVIATSRGGVYTGTYSSTTSPLLSMSPCDVTQPSTIQTIKGSRAVIFAASASKAGGTAAAVDNEGLVNVAKACIDASIPHLVIVSSGAVTKPDSPVFKFLNIFGKIMEEKIKGEDSVRGLYKASGDMSGEDGTFCTYTVIRPGGLTEEEGKGVSALELSQGDEKSGRISRADVAALCIESTSYPKLTSGATFECYDADTGKPLQTVGFSNLRKAKNTDSDNVFVSGKERRGDTWEKIFTGLEKDM